MLYFVFCANDSACKKIASQLKCEVEWLKSSKHLIQIILVLTLALFNLMRIYKKSKRILLLQQIVFNGNHHDRYARHSVHFMIHYIFIR